MRPTALGTAQPRHLRWEDRQEPLNSATPSPSSLACCNHVAMVDPRRSTLPPSAAIKGSLPARFLHTTLLPSSHSFSSTFSTSTLSTRARQFHRRSREPPRKLAADWSHPGNAGTRLTVCLHWEAKLMGRGAYTRMEPNNTKFYQLGNGGSLIFERDLDALSQFLGCPHPEFHGIEINDQPGGELQWVITADLRGKMEPPTSERILFSINWLDGLARALQEALARLCGQNVVRIQDSRFAHLARHDSTGGPMSLSSHPVLKYHVEHLDFMLHETQKELDNARAKKDATIARLRAKIVSLEATFKTQEDQLREMEEDGEDIQGGEAFLSDDDDFEEDENTDVEDYEFMEAGEDDFIPIDVDDE
ncbi:hypothetical protein QYE76_037868 [Lolium multiflorum]|uniref:Uncharacterized protein n=1 Tax=Lolium multiflorum TaxID=4521 RepID=A0AAD8T6W1_LOLMU|nr:hypothetical protein QYE76_037868 [Lolium multiflorum]